MANITIGNKTYKLHESYGGESVIRVYDIDWDISDWEDYTDKKPELSTEYFISLELLLENKYLEDYESIEEVDEDDLSEAIVDILENETGWMVNDYNMENLND